ncbi:hypothetical protein ACJJTC_015185 [Scirpophaga incertulas]
MLEKQILNYFFDVTLTALANDMSRGQQVNGHRILLQMLAKQYPDFCIASLAKSASLRNSYQNRPPIGLSLLWAFGQGGLNDFSVGLKAWQDLFLPIIELKNYSKYVIQYLSTLLDNHTSLENTRISQDQLFAMFDLINNKKNNLSKELSSDLILQLSKYKDIFFIQSGNKLQVTFNQIMKKLPNQYLSGNSLDPYNRQAIATLFDYIDSNWDIVSKNLKWKSLKMTVFSTKKLVGKLSEARKRMNI